MFFSVYFYVDDKGIMHSTQFPPEIDTETQKILIEQVKQQLGPMQDFVYTKTIRKINWSKIEIDGESYFVLNSQQNLLNFVVSGLTAEKAQEEFNKIIKPVRKVKSLAEVIGELEKYPKKYSQDLPKQPPNAMFLYINENREKLIEKKGKLPLVCIEIFLILLFS